ncbi:coiled-coil domain-containing protein 115-like [Haliotis rufescens]|uniref:coiled-coil domain-containing protein 115-like n=1 Tax=Haliotis rufescens TaxID=6454 RepID=UPI00201EDAFA|nr:coiled-coil domain-containing protein 115-like [Haliotis rufescens]XP_046362018.2 coiled-coil domain-containing protein 115-like [Haliotis rufescens]
MTQLEEVSEKLDKNLLDFFDVLGQVYQEQAKLEQYMRDGFLNLSRARYSMGVKSVSATQLPDEMDPLLTILVNGEKKDTKFEFLKTSIKTSKDSVKDETLRKRNVPNKLSDGDTPEVETIGSAGDSSAAAKDESSEKKPGHVDPLKWFGVLVPQALRRSQSSFQEASGLAVTVANLKLKLGNLREDYKTLLAEKQKLLSVEN